MDFEVQIVSVQADPFTNEVRYEAKLLLGGADTGVTGGTRVNKYAPPGASGEIKSRLLRTMVAAYVRRMRESSPRVDALEAEVASLTARLERLEASVSLRPAPVIQFIQNDPR